MGKLTSLTTKWCPLSFDIQGAILRMHSWEGLLDFEHEECVVFYLDRAHLLSCFCYSGVSVHRGQTLAAQPGAHLSPAASLHITSSEECSLPSLRSLPPMSAVGGNRIPFPQDVIAQNLGIHGTAQQGDSAG